MEFLLKNHTLTIESEKKSIELTPTSLILDGMVVDMAGEYEKWGFLLYVHSEGGQLYFHFRVEGYWIAYIPTCLWEITGEILEFLGNIDVLVMPGAKSMIPVLEKIEPRMLITYGDLAHEVALTLAVNDVPTNKYKLKDADLSSDKIGCIVLGE